MAPKEKPEQFWSGATDLEEKPRAPCGGERPVTSAETFSIREILSAGFGAERQELMKSIIIGTAGHIDHGKTA
ncbi:MAG: hypothetical protein ACXV8M_16340, partial [Candidatus Angelobacter sp.]